MLYVDGHILMTRSWSWMAIPSRTSGGPELLDLGKWSWAGPQVLCPVGSCCVLLCPFLFKSIFPKMVPDMHCHTWQEIATEDKTCSRNLGPLSKLLVLRQGDLADTPVSGWLFADSITVMQMMIVILCISSQVINITHALSIQDIKSPKVSIGQRWIWKTVCLEESQTQGILLHQNMLGANKAWHIYGVYISIVTASYLSCIFLIHIWHIYIYIHIYNILSRAFPWRIAIQAEFTGGFGTFPNLQAWKGIRFRAVSVGTPASPWPWASGLEVLELGYSCIADMSHWDPDGSKGDLFVKVCNYKVQSFQHPVISCHILKSPPGENKLDEVQRSFCSSILWGLPSFDDFESTS